jgi:hypothetical protein
MKWQTNCAPPPLLFGRCLMSYKNQPSLSLQFFFYIPFNPFRVYACIHTRRTGSWQLRQHRDLLCTYIVFSLLYWKWNYNIVNGVRGLCSRRDTSSHTIHSCIHTYIIPILNNNIGCQTDHHWTCCSCYIMCVSREEPVSSAAHILMIMKWSWRHDSEFFLINGGGGFDSLIQMYIMGSAIRV